MSFVNSLKGLFSGSSSESAKPTAELDSRLAAAALAVHAIAVDGIVTDDEKATLRRVLKSQFDLDDEEARALIDEAKARDREAVDLYAFTSVIKRSLDAESRRSVVSMLWEVVYADGEVHEFEDNLVWRVAELLDIPTRERVILRQELLAGKGENGED